MMEPNSEIIPTSDSPANVSNEGEPFQVSENATDYDESHILGLDSNSGNFLSNNEQYRMLSRSFQDLQSSVSNLQTADIDEFLKSNPEVEENPFKATRQDTEDETSSVISETEEDESNLSPEELIKKLRDKNAKANMTIETLISHISNYKEVVENEKIQLERELDAEREANQELEANIQEMAVELDQYEQRLQQLETEKHERNKETVQNLENLLEELEYIEKINEDLNTQLEQANRSKNLANEQLVTTTAIVEKLTAKVNMLENDQRIMFKNTWPSQMLSDSELQTASLDILGGETDDKRKIELLLSETQKLHEIKRNLEIKLEKENSRLNSIFNLTTEIRNLSGIAREASVPESEDNSKMALKLIEEKEAHNVTKEELSEAKKKYKQEREKIDALSLRISELAQSHTASLASSLRELDEERETVKTLQQQIEQMQNKEPKPLTRSSSIRSLKYQRLAPPTIVTTLPPEESSAFKKENKSVYATATLSPRQLSSMAKHAKSLSVATTFRTDSLKSKSIENIRKLLQEPELDRQRSSKDIFKNIQNATVRIKKGEFIQHTRYSSEDLRRTRESEKKESPEKLSLTASLSQDSILSRNNFPYASSDITPEPKIIPEDKKGTKATKWLIFLYIVVGAIAVLFSETKPVKKLV